MKNANPTRLSLALGFLIMLPTVSLEFRDPRPEPSYKVVSLNIRYDGGSSIVSREYSRISAPPLVCGKARSRREWHLPLPRDATRPQAKGGAPFGSGRKRATAALQPWQYARYSLRAAPCIGTLTPALMRLYSRDTTLVIQQSCDGGNGSGLWLPSCEGGTLI